MLTTISTQYLRTNLPTIIKQINLGKEFILINKSIPVAEIRKPKNIQHYQEASEEDINNAALRDLEDDFLSDEEMDYYLSLKNE